MLDPDTGTEWIRIRNTMDRCLKLKSIREVLNPCKKWIGSCSVPATELRKRDAFLLPTRQKPKVSMACLPSLFLSSLHGRGKISSSHRLNMEVDLQSLFGLHLTWCAQLFSLAETPQLPTSPRIWTRITRVLLVSKDRRHLFVTPCQQCNLFNFFSYLIYLFRYHVMCTGSPCRRWSGTRRQCCWIPPTTDTWRHTATDTCSYYATSMSTVRPQFSVLVLFSIPCRLCDDLLLFIERLDELPRALRKASFGVLI
jgi:hypothetical protein